MLKIPVKNLIIALVAIALSSTLFIALQTQTSAISLETQAEESVPLEIALSNGQPTLIEFYANWCTSCQAMAADLASLKQEYGEQVNFVMLNVDNPKWLPEILKYRIDGIPHFVYLNPQGEAIAETIGEQPRELMAANLAALTGAQPLPYNHSSGQISEFEAPVSTPNSPTDPRSHGA